MFGFTTNVSHLDRLKCCANVKISTRYCIILFLILIFVMESTQKKQTLMNIENTKAQMRKGILELCILSTIDKNPKYSSEILKGLKESQLLVVEGTLYPLLTRLKNAHLLEYRWEESNSGPPRKYFTITQEGKKFLKELNTSWADLSEAVNTLIKK